MAQNALVDAGFLVALLSRRDGHHRWAVVKASQFPPPWQTSEAVLSEAFHLLTSPDALSELLRRGALAVRFDLSSELHPVLKLMAKYEDVPMSLADACLVRMTEIAPNPIILTTDTDFRVYRRHSRQVVPCITPG